MEMLSQEDKEKCERFHQVRLICANKMSQEEFGKRLGIAGGNGLSKSGVCAIENKRRRVTDVIGGAVCNAFNINPEWLAYGKGDMELQLTKDEQFALFLESLLVESNDVSRKKVFKAMSGLSNEWYEKFEDVVMKLDMEKAGTGELHELVSLINEVCKEYKTNK